MSAPDQISFLVLAEREFAFGSAENAGGNLTVANLKFLAGKEFDDSKDELKEALADPSLPVLVSASMPFAALTIKPSTFASAETFVQDLKSASGIDAADLRIALADGPSGPVALCLSKAALAARAEEASALGLQDFKLYCNGLGTISALQGAIASGKIDKPVLYIAVLKATARVSIVSADGVACLGSVDTGTDAILDEVMKALGLKFPGSAAKLFYGDLYDFDEHAASLVAPLSKKVVALMGSAKGRMPVPAYVYASGLPATRMTLLGGKIAEAIGLAGVECPLLLEGRTADMPTYFGSSSAGTAALLLAEGKGQWMVNLSEPEVDAEALFKKISGSTSAPAAQKPAVPAPAPVEKKPAQPEKPAEAQKPAAAPAPVKPAAPAPKPAPEPQPPANSKGWKRGANKKGPPPQMQAKAPAAKPAPVAPKPQPAAEAPKPVPAKAPAPAKSAEKGKSKTGLIIAAIVVVALIAAGAAVMLGGGNKKAPKPAPQPVAVAEPVAAEPQSEPQVEEVAPSVVEEPAAEAATPVETAATEAEPAAEPVEEAAPVAEEPPPPPPPTTGNVSIQTTPANAEIYIDGQLKGLSPLIVYDLPIGNYTVEIRKVGYKTVTKGCDIEGGETAGIENVALELDCGSLTVGTNPAGIAYTIKPQSEGAGALDESVLTGKTPVDVSGLKPGTYEVTFSRKGWKDYSKTVEIKPAAKSDVTFEYLPGKVSITSTPENASVISSNGTTLGVTPFELTDLPEGPFSATVAMDGYETENVAFDMPFGGSVTKNLTLLRLDRVITRATDLEAQPVCNEPAQISLSARALDGFSGTVYVRFLIGADGSVQDANVINTGDVPDSVIYNVTKTVRDWSFKPGMRKGYPMRVEVVVPVTVTRK